MAAPQQTLYGTEEPPAVMRALDLGPLSLSFDKDMLRSLSWRDVELIRAVSYPVRDSDWGTMPLRTVDESLNVEAGTYLRSFETDDGSIRGDFRLTTSTNGQIEIDLRYEAKREVMVNRAGFTILHPIAGLAGEPLHIRHADGPEETAAFPELICPSQPARNIRGLRYAIDGAQVEIEMSGDVFEMEDQRNWSDASYKTYCRPLTLPFPFRLAAGETIAQRLVIGFSGAGSKNTEGPVKDDQIILHGEAGHLPDLLLAVEPSWELPTGIASAALTRCRRLVRLDLRSTSPLENLRRCLGGTSAPYDLEAITADGVDEMRKQLDQLAADLSTFGRMPDHLLALPAAYLASYQPDGAWPSGATPAQAIEAARACFPEVRIGGGMLTNFTELNRHRPESAAIDYLSHGTTAIVHAADDRSVIETLEALPQIFHSARALADGKPYRLGLVSIGMRSNPYGASIAPNPGLVRKTMAMEDPRHGALFGAAWLLAAVATTEAAGVEAMALAAPSGPFGLVDLEGPTPLLRPCFHVFRALDGMRSGQRLRLRTPAPALHAIATAETDSVSLVAANLSATEQTLALPRPAQVRRLDVATSAAAAHDPDWLLNSPSVSSETVSLPPFALAFARMDA